MRCHTDVVASERYARSRWGDAAEWCEECNGWTESAVVLPHECHEGVTDGDR